MKNVKSFKEFVNESNQLNEGDVNLEDGFGLVAKGGYIGSKSKYPVFVTGGYGNVIETGNDKEVLKEKAKSMRKNLSPGERKHYGMGYTVIQLTPGKKKEIQYLIDFRNKSKDTEVTN